MADLTAVLIVSAVGIAIAIAVPAIGVLAAVAVLIYFGRRFVDERRRRRDRAWVCEHAVHAVNHAESLAELTMLVPRQGSEPTLHSEIIEHVSWLSAASVEFSRRAEGYGLRRASRDLGDALRLLNVELLRNRTLLVSDGARDDDTKKFAVRRLKERSDEIVLSARFVDIVADLDRL